MRIYSSNFNGLLTDFNNQHKDKLVNPRDADAWLVWQDVLGSYGDLIKTAKAHGFDVPTFCLQHGRASTSDYDKPNSYPLSADYYLCWGQSDKDRMTRLGYGDKTHIVGCPLNTWIKPKVQHEEKVILFIPVNTGKEEPENLAVYYELLKIKYKKAQIKVLDMKTMLKDKWTMTNNKAIHDFDVVAKLLPWHDKNMYHGRILLGSQYSPKNNQLIFELLRNVDAVVGLDEGTTEVFAYGHDVPVIIVDGFKYRQYKPNGKDYELIEPYTTKAATHTNLEGLENAINYALEHPEHLRAERKSIAECELGTSYGDANKNILKFMKEKVKECYSNLK